MAVNKQLFYESINKDTLFDESFFKKVYGYSVCDNLFLGEVASKLINLGMPDMVKAYNKWYAAWKANDDLQMKKVAEWYQKELNKEYEKYQKEQQGKAVEGWRESLQNLTTEDLILMLLNNSTKEG